jgi:hypothetical protein
MSEDILTEVEQEFKPKTVRQALILLASEVRQTRNDIAAMKKLQSEQNGKVSKNCDRLTHLETVNKVVYAALGLVAGAIIKVFVG